jgi:hypothetical protein
MIRLQGLSRIETWNPSARDADYVCRFPGRIDLYKAVFHAHDCCRSRKPVVGEFRKSIEFLLFEFDTIPSMHSFSARRALRRKASCGASLGYPAWRAAGSAQFTISSGSVAVLGLRLNGLTFTSIPTAQQ